MGITKFIRKVCVQSAVYWGSPVSDGRGGKTFQPARQIKCRWEDKQRTLKDSQGREFVSAAEVLITEDLQMEGCLWLGLLGDLPGYDESDFDDTDPWIVEGSLEIVAVDKIPMIKSTTEFVRTVYLGYKYKTI